jgi:hypothetical protein
VPSSSVVTTGACSTGSASLPWGTNVPGEPGHPSVSPGPPRYARGELTVVVALSAVVRSLFARRHDQVRQLHARDFRNRGFGTGRNALTSGPNTTAEPIWPRKKDVNVRSARGVRAYHPGHVAPATGAAAARASVPARAGTRSVGERGARRARGGAGGLGGEALGEAEAHVFLFREGVSVEGVVEEDAGHGVRRPDVRVGLGSMTSPSDARDACDYSLNERCHMTENRLGLVFMAFSNT